jgi:UDP-2,3-diacylglucosamine hydrolase
MKVALIADAHIDGPGEGPGPLVDQLRGLAAEKPDRLILLGDIFQAWVGFPQYETASVRAVLDAVAEVRAAGVRVEYIEGNRDFFIAEGAYRTAFDFVGLETAFEAGGKRYLAVHGDGLNDRDRQYLAWRWLSKSWPVKTAIRRLPEPVVSRLVDRTEKKLSRTNFKHKARVPEEAIRRYGERRLAEGHDVLLLGHFHEPHRYVVEGGEVRLLDAWFRARRVERFG